MVDTSSQKCFTCGSSPNFHCETKLDNNNDNKNNKNKLNKSTRPGLWVTFVHVNR